jgi:hypothetical protein
MENYYFFPQTNENIIAFKAIQVVINCNTLAGQLIPISQTDLVNQVGELQKQQQAYFSLTWVFDDIYHNAMLQLENCVFFDTQQGAINFIKNGLIV